MSSFPFRAESAKRRFFASYEASERSWKAPHTPRMIATPFGETFVRICGDESAPPLILLHGMNGSSLSFFNNIEALSTHARVFAVDAIYDYGRSQCTRYPRRRDELIVWLDAVIDGLGLSRVNLLGHSYGGWIAARYALARPERVGRAALLCPAETVLPIEREWLARWLLSRLIPVRHLTRSFYRWLFADLIEESAEGAQLVDRRADETFLAERCYLPRMVVRPDILQDDEWRSVQPKILFLIGANEKTCDADAAIERLRRVAPQVTAEKVEGAGHGLIYSKRANINERLTEFFGSAHCHPFASTDSANI